MLCVVSCSAVSRKTGPPNSLMCMDKLKPTKVHIPPSLFPAAWHEPPNGVITKRSPWSTMGASAERERSGKFDYALFEINLPRQSLSVSLFRLKFSFLGLRKNIGGKYFLCREIGVAATRSPKSLEPRNPTKKLALWVDLLYHFVSWKPESPLNTTTISMSL